MSRALVNLTLIELRRGSTSIESQWRFITCEEQLRVIESTQLDKPRESELTKHD